MSRRSASGPLAAWAEAQRREQRQQEARARAQAQAQRQRAQQQRAYEREAARRDRERQAAYRQGQEAEALRLTGELDARVAVLEGLLAAGCRAPAFGTGALARSERLQPFDPGPLGRPVPMPDPQRYRPPQNAAWGRGARRRAEDEAQARYAHDLRAAQHAEAQRQAQLAAYRRQYDDWAATALAAVRRHNAEVAASVAALRRGDPQAVVEFFSAALYASTAWPEDLPRSVSAAYDPAQRQLVLTWQLPGYEVVPETRSVRYMPTADRLKETPRPATQRRALYRDLLAQCVLLVLRDLFAADEPGALESVALTGYVDGHDPVTGRRSQLHLASVTAARTDFERLDLARVSAVDCLVEALRGQLSARPDQSAAIRPGRLPEDVGSAAGGSAVVTHGGDDEPDLFTMDPLVFEQLVADLFRAMGMQAVTTVRSGDGGVDVDALDPAPITGGSIVVQVKRYRHTVPPTAVRDLFGTVQHTGANKGVLVTTSRFGPTAHTFAHGKPLELVSGEQLVGLLHAHGLRGRLGPSPQSQPAPVASAAGVPQDDDDPAEDHNVLALRWSGDVPLDVCALVCAGTTALGDDHFVFYNNPRTPDGTVRAIPAPPPDRAALRVAFDALPAHADRLVLAAALDPTAVTAHTDLTAFQAATLRLLDAGRAELGSLAVSEGRPGETALVLGSFRRRASGDWDFVPGGKGYPGGLEALIHDYGIDTE